MATIWIANEAGHPYQKALDLIPDAALRPLTLDNVNPLRVDRLTSHLARGIGSYAKEEDYLLISGTPMINALCLAIWLEKFDFCRVIQWNAAQRKYELSTIERDNLQFQIERQMMGTRP